MLYWSLHKLGACDLTKLYRTKSQDTWIRGWGPAGSWLVRSEVRVINHFLRFWGQLWDLFQGPSVLSHGKVDNLRTQELKHKLGQDVIFSLRDPDHVIIRQVRDAVFCCHRDCWLAWERLGLWAKRERKRERCFLELEFKNKFNQSHKEPSISNWRHWPGCFIISDCLFNIPNICSSYLQK